MVSLAQVAVFLPAALLVACSPGANNLLALRNGMRFGLREAVFALSGRGLGFLIMLVLAAAGLAAVLADSQTVFEVVKWVGVAYLAWLGLRGLIAPGTNSSDDDCSCSRGRGRLRLARQEFSTVAANPKALLLFTAFLPQFVDAGRPVAGQLVTLGVIYITLELAAAWVWAGAGQRIRAAGLGASVRRRLDRAVGGVFLGLAGLLATARR